MFEFKKKKLEKISRVVVLGSDGFIGSELCYLLKKKKINFLKINRKKINLNFRNSIKKLSRILKISDTVVFIAGVVPVKNQKMFEENLRICFNVIESIQKIKVKHLIYISSDAVYVDSSNKISEKTKTIPNSLHGIMHLTRELLLRQYFNEKLCIIRPTLIYGENDTHSGYGPNLFFRTAIKEKKINIFGNGEELRDHISVGDVANLISIIISKRGIGVINAVTGKAISFKLIANKIINKLKKQNISLIKIPRNGPMPHNGYRVFNNNILKKYFPTLKIKLFPKGYFK